jgi:hypothetical protein
MPDGSTTGRPGMAARRFADYAITNFSSITPARRFSEDWRIPDMAWAIYEDMNGHLPGVWIEMRSEFSAGDVWKPVMNQIRIPAYAGMHDDDNGYGWMTPRDDIPDVTAQDLRDVAVYVPKLFRHMVMAMAVAETWTYGERPSDEEVMQMKIEELQRLTKGGLLRTRKGKTGQQMEDDALRQWERKYKPRGYSQKTAADEMGIQYTTFRTYLSRARSRRDSKSVARGKR